MATIITQECINCGACEPECPNTAIYQGGVEYDLAGAKRPALQGEIFYIVPEKCTECVGFFDYEACAAVCPVDCCVTDPDRPETEDALMARARELHPDKAFDEAFPSRFSPGRGVAAKEAAPSAGPSPAATAAPSPGAGTAAMGGATRASASVGRIERALPRRAKPLASGGPARVAGLEMEGPFDEILKRAREPRHSATSRLLGLVLKFASPFLGALPDATKRTLELGYGDPRGFSAQRSTALNILLNSILYPVVFYGIGILRGVKPFTEGDKSWIVIGVIVASVETLVRLREGIFQQLPADKMRYGASIYGAPLGVMLQPLLTKLLRSLRSGHVPVEGFYGNEFEAKRERERRYGEVYAVQEFDGGYYVRLELPRTIPPSAAREERGLGDTMPDYDLDVHVGHEGLTIRGSVVDPELRAVCGISPAFPADFRTEIPLGGPLGGFRHRYADKTLEVAVLKAGA
jgi:ferredoxin